jgi:hypothetical protein
VFDESLVVRIFEGLVQPFASILTPDKRLYFGHLLFALVLAEGVEGWEACDDGNEDDADACRNNCIAAECGDGVTRQDLLEGQEDYEACDDGNANNEDACNECRAFPDGTTAQLAVPNCTLLKRIYPNTQTGNYYVINPSGRVIRSACDFDTDADNGPWSRCLFRTSESGQL